MSFALVDCNNFYVSCERVFRPELKGPVIVLSNNDGCVIARSQEAKQIGVPMGAPYFKYRDLMERHKTTIFSSNFTLYGDFSRRVMQTLREFTPDMEIYSIDEAFLWFPHSPDNLEEIRQTVLQWTGIPVSIGLAPTKTLAKAANFLAKKGSKIFRLEEEGEITGALAEMPVGEIWGIGRKSAALLNTKGIYTANQLRQADLAWVRKQLSVTAERIVLELRGTSCLPLEELPASKQSVVTSRTFGTPITKLEDLQEAVATYTARASEKIRSEELAATYISVFIIVNDRQSDRYPTFEWGIPLQEPSSYTPTLITHAKKITEQLFEEGLTYRKAGVFLGGLIPGTGAQPDLFATPPAIQRKKEKLMKLMDSLNESYGKKVLKSAAEASQEANWKMKNDLRSPCYTTNFDELFTVK